MFPASWKRGEVRAFAESLDLTEVERSRDILRRAMDKYPDAVLQSNLRRVFVLGRLTFYGLPYGGTNSLDTLYLANRGRTEGFSDQYLEESFHHELSSILLRNFPEALDRKAWLSANPPGFVYRGDGTEAVRTGTASTRYSARWHAQGFLAQYGTASLEEDFNMVAEGLFAGGGNFWRIVSQYPRLRQKAKAAMRFYRQVSSAFSEETFRAYAEGDLALTASELRR
jgi:hypothetical protein